MKLIKIKSKGQAAMTDSLFFLTIIVALCVLLFKFSSTYGERIDLSINNLYFKEYTNSSLKAIYYADIPLDFDKNINNSIEIDYLITAIKTDFLPDGKIGFSDINSLTNTDDDRDLAKYNLFHTVKSLMHPLTNYDYIYYINNATSPNVFFYFMIKINEKVDYSGTTDIESKYYLCDPLSLNSVREVVENANKIFSSSTPLILQKRSTTENEDISAISNITIWPSAETIDEDLITEEIENLNCKEYIE
jgi:hypothetical protein